MKIALNIIIAALFIVSCSRAPKPIPLSDIDPSYTARGEYLAKSLAACGYCHGAEAKPDSPLSGGRPRYDSYGEVYAANLTSHETGLGDWKIERVVTALRNSIGKGGEGFAPVFHKGFEWMSDTDAISIAAYIKSLPPIENKIERRQVDFIIRNTLGLLDERAAELPGYVPTLGGEDAVARGEYLVTHVARCQQCHNGVDQAVDNPSYLKGGILVKSGAKEKISPALMGSDSTPDKWTQDEIVRYLRTGITKYSNVIDSELCPVNFYKLAAEEDVTAIAAYLRSLSATDDSSRN